MLFRADVQHKITAIIDHPERVHFEELRSIFISLGAEERPYPTGQLYRIAGHRLMVEQPKTKNDAVPRYLIFEFRNLMIELGLIP